jgi:hypothetical protein
MEDFLAARNARWLDRHTGPDGEVRAGVRDLANAWQCDNFVFRWCVRNGLLDRSHAREGGLRHNQIGRLTALVYGASERHRGALGRALSGWLDEREREQLEELERASVLSG